MEGGSPRGGWRRRGGGRASDRAGGPAGDGSSSGDHTGQRCAMCRRRVVVDERGRCPLGHQVIAPARRPDPEARDPSAAVVATFVEPRRGGAVGQGGGQGGGGVPRDAAPSPPTHARTTPDDPGAAAHASVGERGELPPLFEDPLPPVPTAGRAAVPITDLTPHAPSALDLDPADPPWSTPPPAHRERVYDLLPVEQDDDAGPNEILRIIAATAFVGLLLAAAWYLATTL